MPPTQTAVLVAVPEVERAVGVYRPWIDRAAGWGVPPHVTILYPFVAPGEIDDDLVAKLGAVVASVPSFDTVFARTSWFGNEVLYLAPEPDLPFRTLMAAVWDAFPALPPYGGEIFDVVPHLTVGHDTPLPLLQTVAEEVAAFLPIPVRVSTVLLMEGSDESDSWRTVTVLPLATA